MTGLPPRWYLPREDVNMDLLEPSETRTTCAYKGHAATFSFGEHADIGVDLRRAGPPSRADPRPDRLLRRVVDIELDGEPQERPATPFSRR